MRDSRSTSLPVLLALALLPGCASSGPSGAAPIVSSAQDVAVPVEWRRGVEGTLTIVQKGQPYGGIIDGSVQNAWASLQAAYDAIGLPITTRTPSDGLIASVGQRLVRLDGRRASYYLDCGTDLQGPVADVAKVLLTVTSAVQAAPDGTTIIGTRVDGEASNRGTVEGLRDCQSTRRLESLILQHVREGAKR